ncbi:putative heat shock protein 70-interacting protein [Sarcoptes scabiei]|nr:putative heat shock protein 70-interacting protein [Sarcoptes scabiei]
MSQLYPPIFFSIVFFPFQILSDLFWRLIGIQFCNESLEISTEQTCQNYMKAANMMFLGGLVMGIALEHCHLHHRIALKVITMFGSSFNRLMAGVMIVTMFLSMWISNTATTAMMVPIVDDILRQIDDETETKSNGNNMMTKHIPNKADKNNEDNCFEDDDGDDQGRFTNANNQQSIYYQNNMTISSLTDSIEIGVFEGSKHLERHCRTLSQINRDDEIFGDQTKKKILRKAFLLSIAYSANIGGTATLTGTGTNLVFQDVFHRTFPKSTDISFTSWFFYAFPSALVTILGAWILLFLFFTRHYKEFPGIGERIRTTAQRNYRKLGPMTFHEIMVLILFILLLILWFLRQPEIFPGWASLIIPGSRSYEIKDGTPAILIVIILFLVPANFKQFYQKEEPDRIRRLLDWSTLQRNMSWGVIILLGGGFALAYGTEQSKLSDWFSQKLSSFQLAPFLTLFLLVIISASITEMASNVATANVILPVICHMAIQMKVNPLKFLIPVTLSISFAFMLPVSTPPNAIVFGFLNINTFEMALPGFFMNLLAIGVQLISINTWGSFLFALDQYPDWALDQSN